MKKNIPVRVEITDNEEDVDINIGSILSFVAGELGKMKCVIKSRQLITDKEIEKSIDPKQLIHEFRSKMMGDLSVFLLNERKDLIVEDSENPNHKGIVVDSNIVILNGGQLLDVVKMVVEKTAEQIIGAGIESIENNAIPLDENNMFECDGKMLMRVASGDGCNGCYFQKEGECLAVDRTKRIPNCSSIAGGSFIFIEKARLN